MKSRICCLLLVLGVPVIKAQIKQKFDLSTVFTCIDNETYKVLFDSPIIKDVFITKNMSTQTTNDDYEGRYLIGENSTIEFFKPKPTQFFGDEMFDIGIEFKTRKTNELSGFLQNAKAKKVVVKTDSTFTETDAKKQAWYRSVERKSNNLAISLLEYDKTYLQNLGFTEAEISNEMTFSAFNKKVSGGRPYPKKFSSITSVSLKVNSTDATELVKTLELFGFKKVSKSSYVLSGFTINLMIDKKTGKIRLSKIGIKLNQTMPAKTYRIGKTLVFSTYKTSGEILFLN